MTWTHAIQSCKRCGASWYAPRDKPRVCVDILGALRDDRDRWIRLWNRLEAAITHHKKGKSDLIVDEVDEALYAARDRILRDAAGATTEEEPHA